MSSQRDALKRISSYWLPEDWEAVPQPDGAVYYWNRATGEITWQHPGSTSHFSQEGLPLSASMIPPPPLPEGWKELVDETGMTYFWSTSASAAADRSATPRR